MMILKKVGIYKELSYGEMNDPSIYDAIGSEISNKKEICDYLKSGHVLAACAGIVHDVINPEKGPICPPDCLTDGTWAWHADLAYYVAEYDLKLDDAFLEHMKVNLWQIPKDIDMDFDDVEME
jgi:hypothetical protein